MRLQLFEFEDLPWFPDVIRQGGTDYLRYFLNATGFYKPIAPLLVEGLEKTGHPGIVDLCSGGGGAMEQVQRAVSQKAGYPVPVTLTDKFPNTAAYSYLSQKTGGAIRFMSEPVDALATPTGLPGFRTLFSAVHHFSPDAVQALLKQATAQRCGIGIFDGGDKNLFSILGIILFHPLAFLLCTPFFRPFRMSRLLFTYLLPLIPLYTVWDGCVSILRLYSPAELLAMAQAVQPEGYVWKAGKVKGRFGLRVAYLIGYPETTTPAYENS